MREGHPIVHLPLPGGCRLASQVISSFAQLVSAQHFWVWFPSLHMAEMALQAPVLCMLFLMITFGFFGTSVLALAF
jgi:hypothetical protein